MIWFSAVAAAHYVHEGPSLEQQTLPTLPVAWAPNAPFGCEQLKPTAATAVLAVDRGGCTFATKGRNAQEAGYAALLVSFFTYVIHAKFKLWQP